MITDKITLKKFTNSFVNTVVLFAIFISSYIIFYDLDFKIIKKLNFSTALVDFTHIDYNFSLIAVFIAFFGIIKLILQCNNYFKIIIYNLILTLLSIRIFFSGSRRGLLVYIIIIILLLISNIYGLIKKKGLFKNIFIKTYWFLSFLIILIVLSSIYFTHFTHRAKCDFLKSLATQDVNIAKQRLTHRLFRYSSFFSKNKTIQNFHNELWSIKFDPKDPFSGWGTRNYKSVFTLSGKNSDIVPKGSIGYFLDSLSGSCNQTPGFCDNYTKVFNIKTVKDDIYLASVYCYISDDFDGLSARITVGSIAVANKVLDYNPRMLYDLSKKASWQKLSIELKCINDGYIPIYISFTRNNPTPYKGLKGYVIFAHPECKKINLDSSKISNPLNQLTSYQMDYLPEKNYNKIIQRKELIKEYTQHNLNKQLKTSNNEYILERNIVYSSFTFPIISLYNIFSKSSFSDPIKLFINKILVNDTTYYDFSSDLNTNFGNIDFAEDRLSRWKFAIEIFTNEYNLAEKIFGGGFDFISWYGKVFKNDKTAIDYPHNPFLHILLYSGVLGVILYIILLYRVISLYWRYRKEYPIMFFSFIITYFFTFFSGGNPFDPPIMGFFMMLPFLIHMIHKKELSKEVTIIK